MLSSLAFCNGRCMLHAQMGIQTRPSKEVEDILRRWNYIEGRRVLWLGRSIATQVRGLRMGDMRGQGGGGGDYCSLIDWIWSRQVRRAVGPLKNLNITKIPITIWPSSFFFWRHNLVPSTIKGIWCRDCCCRGKMPIMSDFLWRITLTDGGGRDSAMHFLLEGKMHKIPPFLRLMGSGDTYPCMFLSLHRVGLGGARHKLRPFQIDGMWGHNLRPSHHQCLECTKNHAACSL